MTLLPVTRFDGYIILFLNRCKHDHSSPTAFYLSYCRIVYPTGRHFAFSPHYSLHLFPSRTQAQLLHIGECVFTFPQTGFERTELLSDRWCFVLMESIREASGLVKHSKEQPSFIYRYFISLVNKKPKQSNLKHYFFFFSFCRQTSGKQGERILSEVERIQMGTERCLESGMQPGNACVRDENFKMSHEFFEHIR